MKINNFLVFILLITLFIFLIRMYREGMTKADYDSDVSTKNNLVSSNDTLLNNLKTAKDYSVYNAETLAMATKEWYIFIILCIVSLVILLFTLKYFFS
jgi:hypothetical protein